MDKITATYAFFRRLEEKSGFIVKPGERLVYTARSRFPWLDPIFDEPLGIGKPKSVLPPLELPNS